MLWSKTLDLELQFKRIRANISYMQKLYPEVHWKHAVKSVFFILDADRLFSHLDKVVLKERFADLDGNDLDKIAILLVNTPLRRVDTLDSLFVELEVLAQGCVVREIERFNEQDREVVYYQAGMYTVRVEISDSLFEFALGSDPGPLVLSFDWSQYMGYVPRLPREFDIKPLAYCGRMPITYQLQSIES